ncbi:hypothetical protein lerEdw1_015553 [Lerista edwardsae]|nr:hypothetical protein lerEdw1_015553 [Lerista edwardsae]
MVKKKGRKTVNRKAHPKRQAQKNPSDVFVIKVLRRLHRDKVHISTKAKGKIISFIRKFYNRVSEKANNSSQCKKSCVIGSRELQNALKRVMRDKQATELVKSIRKVSRRR